MFDDGDKRARTPRSEVLSEGDFLNEFTEDYYRETTGGMEPPRLNSRGKRKRDVATHGAESEKKLKSGEKQQVFRHDLLGRTILREWIDRSLNERKLYGIVRRCFKDTDDGSQYLEVEYTDQSIDIAKEIMPWWSIPKTDTSPEEVVVRYIMFSDFLE